MNKVIFYGSTIEAIHKAFSDEQIGECSLYDEKSFLSSLDDFKETEIIFATWIFPSFTEEELKRHFPSLKAFFYAAGSVQAFARAMYRRGVRVYSGWRANAVPVAEWTAAQIILDNKGFFQMPSRYRTLGFQKTIELTDPFAGNFRNRVGIIGCGMIGTHVCELLSHYDLEVVVYDPYLPDEKAEKLGVKKVTLEELFSTSQTITNHLPDLPSTRGMLDYKLFSLMKDNATFINTGRGQEVVEEDLVRAMREKRTRLALLDVTTPREPLETDDHLFKEENIIITPHRAGAFMGEIRRLGEYVYNSYLGFLEGKTDDRNEVTLDMLEHMA